MSRLLFRGAAVSVAGLLAAGPAGSSTTAGPTAAKIASSQLGVHETPAGSNRGARIDRYWTAVRGGQAGAPAPVRAPATCC